MTLSVTPTPAPAHSTPTGISALVQSIALDVAGVGLLASGVYCVISGKAAAVSVPLFTFGGTYLGYKAAS